MISIAGIKRMLPHRFPMLLVDRVTELVPGERLVALKAVTVNEPWYRSLPESAEEHAYDYPMGLLVESWCQAAGLLGGQSDPARFTDHVLLLGSIQDVRFEGSVRPGDVVEHRVRLLRDYGENLVLEGESVVADRTVVRVGRAFLGVRPAHSLGVKETSRR